MTQAECTRILEQHAEWLATNCQSGTQADFTAADLRGQDFTGANLRSARFTRADCRGANFIQADCSWTDFRAARCVDALFHAANCRGAKFMGADLRETQFYRADVHATNFQDSRLSGIVLDPTYLLQLGPLGSRRDLLVVLRQPDGLVEARTGCFYGTLDDLEAAVLRIHPADSRYRIEYLEAITTLRRWIDLATHLSNFHT